jgi:hypothetical protein
LEDCLRGEYGAVDFQHVLSQDKVFPPQVYDVCLESASRRTIIKETPVIAHETASGSINLESFGIE